MSVWKKVSKISQKQHRERHQPNKRSHLGILEKHKDYKKRSNDYHKKDKVIKKLKEKALNKNPNEYYHHMVNSELRNDKHIEKSKQNSVLTNEQKLVLEHKNISYVDMVLNIERNQVEKLKSSLHLIDFSHSKNKHLSNNESTSLLPALEKKTLNKINALKEKKYKELMKRMERKKELTVIKEKMEVERNLKMAKRVSRPKMISEGTKTKAAVYEWKYERKK